MNAFDPENVFAPGRFVAGNLIAIHSLAHTVCFVEDIAATGIIMDQRSWHRSYSGLIPIYEITRGVFIVGFV